MINIRDEKFLTAIKIIGNSNEGKILFDWFKASEVYYEDIMCGIKDEIELRWIQGKLQDLDIINSTIDNVINPKVNKNPEHKEKFKQSLVY